MDYQDYMKSELLILVPVLYFIGIGLKKSKLSNKWISVALGLIGILLSAIWVIGTTDISGIKEGAMATFIAITQGILAAGTSVYVNQIYTQVRKSKKNDGDRQNSN